MNNVSFLLAWRYLLGSKNERSISWMVIICFISIFIGSFSLAVVTAIMNGFEKETCKKLQGINAPVTIHGRGQNLNWPAIQKVITTEFPLITACSPTTTKQVIVQLPGSDDISNIVMLRAIDPTSYADVTMLEQMIVKKQTKEKTNLKKLKDIIQGNHILIGSTLAKSLEVKQLENVAILFTPEENIESQRIQFEQRPAVVGGLFHSGIDEFDAHIAYCSFDLMEQLFPDSGVTHIELNIKPGFDENSLVSALKKRLKLTVYSWKQLYPALVSALKLEKYAMFFILSLIILVASMNIISLLFMQIVQKRGDIAILKALGMADKAIRTVFLGMGMIISLIATLSGLGAALCACCLLKKYPFIQLPDAYYVTHLPVSIELNTFILIFITIMAISFVSTWLATYKTNRITIASVLRFEA